MIISDPRLLLSQEIRYILENHLDDMKYSGGSLIHKLFPQTDCLMTLGYREY